MNHYDQQREADRRRDEQARRDEIERQDRERRERERHAENKRVEEAARQAEADRLERQRQDEILERLARAYAEKLAIDKREAWAASIQHKSDLQARSDQLKKDLWARTDREKAEQNAAIDATIRQRNEFHRARALVETEIAKRVNRSARHVQTDPSLDLADAGVALLHTMFVGGSPFQGADSETSFAIPESGAFTLSDLSDSDLRAALALFDFGDAYHSASPPKMDEAQLRRLAEETAAKNAELERIRAEKRIQLEREYEDGKPFGLHEQWNWRLKIRLADVEFWQNVLISFPYAWPARNESYLGTECKIKLGVDVEAPAGFEDCQQLWEEFKHGFFKESNLFSEDGTLRQEVQEAAIGQAEDPCAPLIGFDGKPEFVDVIALLRRGDLISYNLEHPDPHMSLSRVQLCEKVSDGSLYEYTFERLKRLADTARGLPAASGRILGILIRLEIMSPQEKVTELPMPNHGSRYGFRS